MDVQGNTVLVTGGRGFIGRAVVKVLQDSGCEVVSLDVKREVKRLFEQMRSAVGK